MPVPSCYLVSTSGSLWHVGDSVSMTCSPSSFCQTCSGRVSFFCLCYLQPNVLQPFGSVTKWLGLALQWPQPDFPLEQLHVAHMAQSHNMDHHWLLGPAGACWIPLVHMGSYSKNDTAQFFRDLMAADLCPCSLIVKTKKKKSRRKKRATWISCTINSESKLNDPFFFFSFLCALTPWPVFWILLYQSSSGEDRSLFTRWKSWDTEGTSAPQHESHTYLVYMHKANVNGRKRVKCMPTAARPSNPLPHTPDGYSTAAMRSWTHRRVPAQC